MQKSSGLSALIFGCSLKPSPNDSSTDVLAKQLGEQLGARGVNVELVRAVNYAIAPGVETDMGDGDEWPILRQKMLDAHIVIIATPTWAGHMSSVAMRVIERLDAELAELNDDGVPLVYGKVAGAVVVGNEDGAHSICAAVFQALNDYGFTIPPASATYWNGEAMGSVDYKDLDHTPERTAKATQQMAENLVHAAKILKQLPYTAA